MLKSIKLSFASASAPSRRQPTTAVPLNTHFTSTPRLVPSLQEMWITNLFSRRKARHRSSSELQISGPTSTPFDFEKYPVPPWQNSYSTHMTHPVPAPPPKSYSAEHRPRPLPPIDPFWNNDRRSQKSPSSAQRGMLRRKVFQNRGVDERGVLRPEYEEIGDTDWGIPDAWRS